MRGGIGIVPTGYRCVKAAKMQFRFHLRIIADCVDPPLLAAEVNRCRKTLPGKAVALAGPELVDG